MPPFHGERTSLYGRLMREITDRVIDRWPLGDVFPVHREMQAITLDIILRAVFGLDEGAGTPRRDVHRPRRGPRNDRYLVVLGALPRVAPPRGAGAALR